MFGKLFLFLFLSFSLFNCTTVCPTGTQCKADYSNNGEGCCMFENAVCCPNKQTCCPEGYTCVDEGTYNTTCIQSTQANITGQSVCKPGPQNHFVNGNKSSVLIIGDSVSIGYTPVVYKNLSDIAVVQHSPADVRDGGAEETAYGIQCLDTFLRYEDGTEVEPDFIMFNWGLHDGPLGNSTTPGQQGNTDVYAAQLEEIVVKLQKMRPNSMLLFALTSPMLCNLDADYNVIGLNKMAKSIMDKHNIPTINLHDTIVGECGPVPQDSCFGTNKCFCPHCPGAGYEWVADNVIAPKIRAMLNGDKFLA